MPTRQEIRSEETKRAILNAARDLFAARGYDSVTMMQESKTTVCQVERAA
jgi:AcrR family transcriptional regulator